MKSSLYPPRIDCFLPYGTETQLSQLVEQIKGSGVVRRFHVICTKGFKGLLPDGCLPLTAENLSGTAVFEEIAKRCEAEYCLLYQKTLPLELGFHALERWLCVADDTQAAMIYADHYTIKDGQRQSKPLIDYQPGSLRRTST